MLTERQAKALRVLRDHTLITARQFGLYYFDEERYSSLHTAVSNQGNGACAGKKAWLCAGSILGKLSRAGLVQRIPYTMPIRFRLTAEGEDKLLNETTEKP